MTTLAHPFIRTPRVAIAKPKSSISVREESRWILFLLPTFVAAAVFFAIAMATKDGVWLGPALVLGPIAMMFALIYLAISSDSNVERAGRPTTICIFVPELRLAHVR